MYIHYIHTVMRVHVYTVCTCLYCVYSISIPGPTPRDRVSEADVNCLSFTCSQHKALYTVHEHTEPESRVDIHATVTLAWRDPPSHPHDAYVSMHGIQIDAAYSSGSNPATKVSPPPNREEGRPTGYATDPSLTN